ncbi:MAG: PQQ-dependent sugar dehydrogenase, partial [Opitutus sp.]
TPWGIEFIDAHRALVTERPGRLRWIVDGRLDPQPIQGLPVPVQYADAGMMDVALDPDYAKNGWVYLAFSHSLDGGTGKDSPAMTKVIRGRIRDHEWLDEQTVFALPPEHYVTRAYRWGCRLLFDEKGDLYFSIGDLARDDDVQNLSRPSGKIYRVHPDGSIPADNPFADRAGALPAIYTYGNRNAQGLARHPVTGQIWETEHGPMGGDELNLLKKGANYGWPLVTYGRNYNGAPISALTEHAGMESPVVEWTPSIAVCPAEFYTGTLFPEWRNDLFVGALAYEEVRHLVIKDNRVVSQEIILKNLGRVRDIKTGPDGALYVLLNHPDILLRLVPAGPHAP